MRIVLRAQQEEDRRRPAWTREIRPSLRIETHAGQPWLVSSAPLGSVPAGRSCIDVVADEIGVPELSRLEVTETTCDIVASPPRGVGPEHRCDLLRTARQLREIGQPDRALVALDELEPLVERDAGWYSFEREIVLLERAHVLKDRQGWEAAEPLYVAAAGLSAHRRGGVPDPDYDSWLAIAESRRLAALAARRGGGGGGGGGGATRPASGP